MLSVFLDKTLSIMTISVLKLIYKFNMISIKIKAELFVDLFAGTRQADFKIICKNKQLSPGKDKKESSGRD